jgi:phage terminase small subunit
MRIAKRRKANRRCRQLTPRQAIFTRSLLGGATITEAARNAGYSEKNLAQSGHQAFQVLRSKMPELMDEMELTAQM